MKSKKKILFFLNSFQIGGAHLQMAYLIQELKKEDFEPVICTHINDDGGLREFYYDLDVRIYNLSRKSKLDFSILKKLKSILISENIDIIVLFIPQNFIYFRLVNFFLNRKVYQIGLLRAMGFWLGHKNAFFKVIDDLICARFIKTSDIVLANSKAIKAKYDYQLKLPSDRIKVVYNSSDFVFNISKSRSEIRRELGICTNDILVIMVARLDPWKDFDTLLDAARILKNQSKALKFIICGGGQLEQELNDKIARYSLQTTVFLLGEKKNVHDYINASDISVLTTKGEGFSNAIMESMALAKPVIASDVGGNSELIGHDGACGFLIKSNDYESLSEILSRLSESPEQLSKIGIKARERILSLCNKEKNMGLMLNEFKSLI